MSEEAHDIKGLCKFKLEDVLYVLHLGGISLHDVNFDAFLFFVYISKSKKDITQFRYWFL